MYALRDPGDSTVFYVGKGKGNRAYQHARAAVKSEGARNLKSGASTRFTRLGALTLGLPADLSNPIAGHGERWSSLEQLRHLEAPRVEIAAEHRPCILIRPRKKHSDGGGDSGDTR